MLGLCKSPEQSGDEVGQVNNNLQPRQQLSFILQDPTETQKQQKVHLAKMPHCALLSCVPSTRGSEPSVTSSFAAGLEEALTCLFRGEMGQCRLSFAFLMLLHAWGWLLPGGALQAGGWEGLISSVRKKGRRKCACTRTRREKVFPKNPAMYSLIFE